MVLLIYRLVAFPFLIKVIEGIVPKQAYSIKALKKSSNCLLFFRG